MSAARDTAPAVAMVTETVAQVSDALARVKCRPHEARDGSTVANCPTCETANAVEVRKGARGRGSTIAC